MVVAITTIPSFIPMILLAQNGMNIPAKTINKKSSVLYELLENMEKEDTFEGAIPVIDEFIDEIEYPWMIGAVSLLFSDVSTLADIHEILKSTVVGYVIDTDDFDVSLLKIYTKSENDELGEFAFYNYFVKDGDVEELTIEWREEQVTLVKPKTQNAEPVSVLE